MSDPNKRSSPPVATRSRKVDPEGRSETTQISRHRPASGYRGPSTTSLGLLATFATLPRLRAQWCTPGHRAGQAFVVDLPPRAAADMGTGE